MAIHPDPPVGQADQMACLYAPPSEFSDSTMLPARPGQKQLNYECRREVRRVLWLLSLNEPCCMCPVRH